MWEDNKYTRLKCTKFLDIYQNQDKNFVESTKINETKYKCLFIDPV